MTRRWSLGALVLAGWLFVPSVASAQTFIRGDANNDGALNIADPIFTLSHLYSLGVTPVIPDAADTNDNGVIEVSDTTYTLLALFAGGAPLPPAPFPAPGVDTTPPNFPTAPTGEVSFRLDNATGCGGAQTVVAVHVTNSVPLEATNIRVEFDINFLSFADSDDSPAALILGEEPDFHSSDDVGGAVVMGTVFNLVSPTAGGLQPQVDGHLYNLVFNVGGNVSQGMTLPLVFADDPTATVPSFNLGSNQGQVILADTTDGSITSTCMAIEYLRGDHNEDGAVSVSDAVHLVEFLFLNGPDSGCSRTGDTNGSNQVDIADAVHLLNAIFGGSTMITPPFPTCGPDLFVSFVSCNNYNGNCP